MGLTTPIAGTDSGNAALFIAGLVLLSFVICLAAVLTRRAFGVFMVVAGVGAGVISWAFFNGQTAFDGLLHSLMDELTYDVAFALMRTMQTMWPWTATFGVLLIIYASLKNRHAASQPTYEPLVQQRESRPAPRPTSERSDAT